MKGRGARKLELALEQIHLPIQDSYCIDLGASHGGFVRTLLENGAARVSAVDVAYGILDYSLRVDPRVSAIERSNVRNIEPSWFEDLPSSGKIIVTCDVSFMSIRTVLASLADFLHGTGLAMEGLFLVKPQFEDSKSTVKGILKDPIRREEIISEIRSFCVAKGFEVKGRMDLPEISGKNLEVFLHLSYEK